MNNFVYYSPTKVYFGKDMHLDVGSKVKEFGGTKVLIQYGTDRVIKNGLMDVIQKSLAAAGIGYVVAGGIVPNPRLSQVREATALAKKEGVDFVLAVGGGSVIDACKAAAMAVCYEGDVWDFYTDKVQPVAALPVASVLTIAAAGSETSDSTVITNEDNWIKIGYSTPLVRPKFTIMNPEFMFTLPPYQTAAGVVDIMMHTLDRYFSPGGCNELTDRIAEEILQVTSYYGRICMEDPENYEARSEVMWAGSLSHNDLTGLGLAGDFAVHMLEHELSGKYDVTHGAGLAAVWGAWARYVYKANVSRFVRYAVNVWKVPMNYENPETTALEGIRRTEQYFASIGMPITIGALVGKSISDADIEDMAEKCVRGGQKKIGRFMELPKAKLIEIYKNAR